MGLFISQKRNIDSRIAFKEFKKLKKNLKKMGIEIIPDFEDMLLKNKL